MTHPLEVKQKSGPKRSTTEKQGAMIQSIVAPRSIESACQIAVRLSEKGRNISEAALRRRFKEAGVQSMTPTFKSLLSSDHIKKKFEWAIKHTDIDWNQMVFTDEGSFYMKHVIRCVWKRCGENYYVSTQTWIQKTGII
ncbi:unnamed protein product [Rotaria magnacalcarata]|uniref:Transposase Tc1-like domain-containing protein n=1 Tax=Rotaria magnacalcarata TaxID=392030 RepID=A0A819UIN4_9BILA|nr:unnamed protein product [Rotaria magnacalcarata]